MPLRAASLAKRERAVQATLAEVAAIQLEALPLRSLVRRLVEPLLHELDCWATDPRYSGQALGYGGVEHRNRPRPGSVEERYALDMLRLRQEGHTQREVAEQLRCAQSPVCRIERKLRRPPRLGDERRSERHKDEVDDLGGQ